MTVTTIYLVRHAHSEWRADNARPLSESGFEAAQRVADRLSALPITAIYSSPHQRSVDTVAPLAHRLGILPRLATDLRERELPAGGAAEFHRVVEESWRSPAGAIDGGESNVAAQARGLAVVRTVIVNHEGQHVVVSTHGNLLALILNGFDSTFGYESWRQLSFPDVYRLEFDGMRLLTVQRLWSS